MPSVVDIVLRARNEASRAIGDVANELGGLAGTAERLSAGAGPIGAVAAAAVAAGGALIVFGRQFSDVVEQLGRTSKATGVAISDLEVLRSIVKDNGGDADALTGALFRLNKSIGEGNPLLARMGITTKDTTQAFLQLTKILAASNDTARKTAIEMQLMGKAVKEIAPDIDNIADTFAKRSAEMRADGELMSTDLIAKGKRLDAAFDTLGHNWAIAWNNMAGAVAPAANVIVKSINDIFQAATRLGGVATGGFFTDIAFHMSEGAKGAADEAAEMKYLAGAIDDVSAKLVKLIEKRNVVAELPHIAASLDKDIGRRANELQKLRQTLLDLQSSVIAGGGADQGGQKPLPDLGPLKVDPAALRRVAEIKAIEDELHVGLATATAFYDKLQQIESDTKAEGLKKKLGIAGPVPGFEVPEGEQLKAQEIDLSGARPLLVGIEETMTRLATHTMPRLVVQWQLALKGMTSAAAVAEAGIGAAMNGLANSLQTVFMSIYDGVNIMKLRVGDLIRNMVDQIIGELSRLAAAAIFKLILSVFTGGASRAISAPLDIGVPVSAPVLLGLTYGVPGQTPASTTSALSMAAGGPGGAAGAQTTNVTIQAIDSKSIQDAFRAGNGAFRQYERRTAAAVGF